MKLDEVIKNTIDSLAEYELPEYGEIVLRKASHTVESLPHGLDDIEVSLTIRCFTDPTEDK